MIKTKTLFKGEFSKLPLDEQASIIFMFGSMYHAYKENQNLCVRDFGAPPDQIIDMLKKLYFESSIYIQNVILKTLTLLVLYNDYSKNALIDFINTFNNTPLSYEKRLVVDTTLKILDSVM